MKNYIFLKIENEVEDFLKEYPVKIQEAGDRKAVLFILDRKAIQFLKEKEKEINIEYSDDKSLYRKYNFSNIIKVINWEEPCHIYRTYSAYHWREINDQDKVFDNLDKELEKSFNKQMVNVKKQLDKKEVSQRYYDETIARIKDEYNAAKIQVDFMKENKDRITARISEYSRRRKYPRIDCTIKKKKQNSINLKTTAMNGVWFEELNEEESRYATNKLVDFLDKAVNPFGDVYYVVNDDNEVKEDEQ